MPIPPDEGKAHPQNQGVALTVFGNRDFTPAHPRTAPSSATALAERPELQSSVAVDDPHAEELDSDSFEESFDASSWPAEVAMGDIVPASGRETSETGESDRFPREWTPVAEAEREVDDTPDLPPVVALPGAFDLRRLVLRLRGGDEIEVDRVEGREPAIRMARDLIAHIEAAQYDDQWPQLGDRFIRPNAIISIDVQRAD